MRSIDDIGKDLDKLEKQYELMKEAQDKILNLCQELYKEVKKLQRQKKNKSRWGDPLGFQ